MISGFAIDGDHHGDPGQPTFERRIYAQYAYIMAL
jgi:hypothetical protein